MICPLAHTSKNDSRTPSFPHGWGEPHSSENAYDEIRASSRPFGKFGGGGVDMRETAYDTASVFPKKKNACG